MGSKQTVTYFNFAGGLNTEASSLAVPATDLVEATNIVIERSGAVRRRTAIDFLGVSSTGEVVRSESIYNTTGLSTYDTFDPVSSIEVFTSITTNGTKYRHLFTQFGKVITIYDYDNVSAILDLESPNHTFTLDSDEAAFYRTTFLQDGNRILVINNANSLFYLEFNGTTFDKVDVDAFVRDLDQDTPLADSVRENGSKFDLSKRFIYKAIKSHTSAASNEPGVGVDWQEYWVKWSSWAGGLTDTDVTDWLAGATINSNIIPLDLTQSKFKVGALTGGRLFTIKDNTPNTIYFSQIITDKPELYGRFYQFADPFSGKPLDDPNVVATDGGTIVINEADLIVTIKSFSNGVLVFATNGVWFLTGPDGFNAVDYYVQKVSDAGCIAPDGVVAVENNMVYCGVDGIYVLSADDTFAQVSPTHLTSKIQSRYTDIPLENRELISLKYNPQQRVLYVLHNQTNYDWGYENNKYKIGTHYRDILVYDVTLQSWYEHSLEDDSTGTKTSIACMGVVPVGVFGGYADVVDSSGDNIVWSGGGNVVTSLGQLNLVSKGNLVILHRPNTGETAVEMGFGALDETGMVDFATDPDTNHHSIFNSEFVTGFTLYDDVIRVKRWPLVLFMFKIVETGVVDSSGVDENPGACNLYTLIDTVSTGTKARGPFPIYNADRFGVLTKVGGGFTEQHELVEYKHKLRGRGRGFQLKFTNDGAKDFNLQGYQLLLDVSQRI